MARKKEFLNCKNRKDLAAFFGISIKTLNQLAYGPHKYTEIQIPKKSGGIRVIAIPNEQTKRLQKKIASVLEEFYKVPVCVKGFQKKRNHIDNATEHIGKKYVLNFDLKDFFHSIHIGRVINFFKSYPFNFPNEVASALASMVCLNNALPQGAPSSPILSNMICYRMDKQILAFVKKIPGAHYTRYADDITFSSNRKLPRTIIEDVLPSGYVLGQELKLIISSNYFNINDSKTRLSFGAFQAKYVTGIKVNSKLNVNKKYIDSIRGALHSWKVYGLKNAEDIFKKKYKTNKDFKSVIRGRIEYVGQVKGRSDFVYIRLYNKFVLLIEKPGLVLPADKIQVRSLKSIKIIADTGNLGSGFIYKGEYLITAYHVVQGAHMIEYFPYNHFLPTEKRKANTMRFYKFDESRDIAIIRVGKTDDCFSVQEFSNLPLLAGENFTVVGFPGKTISREPSQVNVRVTNTHKYNDVLNVFVDRSLVSGYSGSPVFDRNNHLAGMAIRGSQDMSTGEMSDGHIFLAASEINFFFKSVKSTL